MKKLVSVVVAVGLAVTFASPVLAAAKTPTTKAACEKAKMAWDDSAKKVLEEQHVALLDC